MTTPPSSPSGPAAGPSGPFDDASSVSSASEVDVDISGEGVLPAEADGGLQNLDDELLLADLRAGRVSLRLQEEFALRSVQSGGLTSWGAWSEVADGPVLAIGYQDGSLSLCNADGSLRAEVQDAHGGGARSRRPGTGAGGWRDELLWGAWHLVDGRSALATGGLDGQVRLWSPDGELLWDAQEDGHRLGGAEVTWGAWSPQSDACVLATGHSNGVVRLWNGTNGSLIRRLEVQDSGQSRFGAWQTDTAAPILATGYRHEGIHLWTSDGSALGNLGAADDGPAWRCAWARAPLGHVLWTSTIDGKLTFWNVKERSTIGEPIQHRGAHLWGTWSPAADAPVLATGTSDGAVDIWNADGTHRGGQAPASLGSARACAWAPLTDFPVLATAKGDGHVRLWDGDCRPIGPAMRCHTGSVNWLTWTTIDGVPVLTTGGNDNTVRSWRLVRDVAVPASPYRSDSTHGATDALDRTREATALADVITARSAQPPLAIGVFGHWGDGKSQFLDMLHDAVGRRAQLAAAQDPVTHSQVRQVRFNAWHYTETDLWASLVAELFTQLSEPTPTAARKTQQRQQSRLASELINARGLHEKLAATEERLAALRAAYSPAPPAWEAVPRDLRDRLGVLAGPGAESLFDDAARAPHDVSRAALSTRRLLAALPRRWVWLAAACVVLAFALAVVAPRLIEWATQYWLGLAALPGAVALATIAGAFGAAASRLRKAVPVVRDALARTAGHVDARDARLADAIARTDAEAHQLRRSLGDLTAAGQLAGIVQNRVGEGRYRQRLGLMSEIRQDFERMAELLLSQAETDDDSGAGAAQEAAMEDAAGDKLPQIKRIVLYIDDLDRCPPSRVVEVLEAIHLLLAVPLFVVVVAVDPRWLLRSLTSHYRELFTPAHRAPAAAPQRASGAPLDIPAAVPDSSADPIAAGQTGTPTGPDVHIDLTEEDLWASTPAQYLEKIFQIVLTLPPMQRAGYQNMINELLAVRAPTAGSRTGGARTGTTRPPTAPAGAPLTSQGGTRAQSRASTLADVPLVPRLDPLAVTDDELRLLSLLGPPLIASPRSVKRLANSYGLLAALSVDATGDRPHLRPHELPDRDGSPAYSYRAAATLLAAVIGYPALGPALFLHLHRCAAGPSSPGWTDYLQSLRPHRSDGAWTSPLEGSVTATRAHHTHAMLDALMNITVAAKSLQPALPLPQRLDLWAAWVVPVGRLSFPTGSAVSRLMTPDASSGTAADAAPLNTPHRDGRILDVRSTGAAETAR